MVSIILPTYNGEKYIKDSIISVLNQSIKDWELIIIDDCSTDDTSRIIKEFADRDSRIIIHRNKTNMKLPASLNVGFQFSRGDLLTWTSDDNIFHENALERLVKIMEKNPNLGLVFSRMEYIDNDGNLSGMSSPVNSIEDIKFKNIVGASFMYTRKVYTSIGEYDITKFLVEDYDYWLRISRKFNIYYLSDILYKYRVHGKSLTQSKNKEMLLAKIKLYEEELELETLNTYISCQIYKELALSCFCTDQHNKMCKYIDTLKSMSREEYKSLDIKLKLSRSCNGYLIALTRKLHIFLKKII